MISIPKLSPSDLCRQSMADSMQECRSLTLALFKDVDYTTFCQHVHPDFSPIGWHLGHIAYTEAMWILQRLGGYAPLFPEYHRLFAQDGLAKRDRVHLPEIPVVLEYLETVRSKVFHYLEVAPISQQERLWRWLLQHESQHAETITLVQQLLKLSSPPNQSPIAAVTEPIRNGLIQIPAGAFIQGSIAIDAQDNERPSHEIYLDDYWIDRYPVTCGEYRSFINADGYRNPQWWSPEGWQWLQTNPVTHPLCWTDDPRYDNHPICGVSWYEADAYARFVGKRLPTEAEWEKAASWNAKTRRKFKYPWGNESPNEIRCNSGGHQGKTTSVDRYAQNVSPFGCCDMIGNVWEWTATWFEGYRHFEHYPYPGYSAAYFDQAHRVLKGGSWATRSWAMRNSFRNWYHPHVREILAGFRCVSDTSEPNL
jgi:gamma-glutamyl hercynylcysteine S-oxide synthase